MVIDVSGRELELLIKSLQNTIYELDRCNRIAAETDEQKEYNDLHYKLIKIFKQC